jgi:hypothetical protein
MDKLYKIAKVESDSNLFKWMENAGGNPAIIIITIISESLYHIHL